MGDGRGRRSAPDRLLDTLEHLLDLPSGDLETSLSQASDLVADATGADKVDAFLYDSTRDSLVAVGTSHQPLSALQRKLGLDVLPVSNGGRVAHVYETGEIFLSGNLDTDPHELRGVKDALGIRSKLGVPLVVAGTRRGVLMIASQKPDYFTSDDVRFAEAVARWTATVAHRAELVEQAHRNAAEEGRRAGAEELVTVLAHDLRNLIAPITTLLDLLQRRAEGDGRQEDVTYVTTAQRGLRRFRALMDDILDSARIDAGLFNGAFEPLDLVALIEETARTLSAPSQPIDVRVRATGPLSLSAEAGRLRQCLENVIANAIQKSPKDASVRVVVSSETRDHEEWAVVEIIDEGPGIPRELQARLFERFVTTKDGAGGLGLGLYLARQIALMHGGELTVDQTPRKGARFILTLPLTSTK